MYRIEDVYLTPVRWGSREKLLGSYWTRYRRHRRSSSRRLRSGCSHRRRQRWRASGRCSRSCCWARSCVAGGPPCPPPGSPPRRWSPPSPAASTSSPSAWSPCTGPGPPPSTARQSVDKLMSDAHLYSHSLHALQVRLYPYVLVMYIVGVLCPRKMSELTSKNIFSTGEDIIK